MRTLLIILLVLVALIAGAWFSVQQLPSWYDQGTDPVADTTRNLDEQIRAAGTGNVLGKKIGEILSGELTLTDAELNALVIAALKADEDGRRVLEVSDAIRTHVTSDGLELGAVINLNKVERINPKARKAVEKVNKIFPFLDQSRLAVTLIATPVARNGMLGIKDDFSLRLGAIPISNSSLRQLGAKVERANKEHLDLRILQVNSVRTTTGQLLLGVSPAF